MKNKFDVKDLEKVLKFLKSQAAVDVTVSSDDMNRLVFTVLDAGTNMVQVIIYASESKKMPDVTRTERLL